MRLRDDVTRDMLMDVIQGALNDIRLEQRQALSGYQADSKNSFSRDVSIIYQMVDEMITARIDTLCED